MICLLGFTVNDELVSGDFNILVDCLTDTFEDNKMEAYKLLKHWSDLDIMKQVCVSYIMIPVLKDQYIKWNQTSMACRVWTLIQGCQLVHSEPL